MTPPLISWRQAAAVLASVGLGAILLSSCGSPAPQQEAQPPAAAAAPPAPAEPAVALPVSYNALMVTMIDNAGHVLWDIEKERDVSSLVAEFAQDASVR